MPACNVCHQVFSTWPELALHIATTKKGHRRGKVWAASVLTNVRTLDQKRGMPERSPMTPEERESVKEAKEETHRELSGEAEMVMTVCPNCKRASRQNIPKEYTDSSNAWRTGNGTLIICCPNCRRS
jgi:hypothetical protein